MNATFQDSDGQDKPFVMGCYGIGVSRVVAAAIEQNHDDNGIIFPLPLAPFQVIVLNLGPNRESGHCRPRSSLQPICGARGWMSSTMTATNGPVPSSTMPICSASPIG